MDDDRSLMSLMERIEDYELHRSQHRLDDDEPDSRGMKKQSDVDTKGFTPSDMEETKQGHEIDDSAYDAQVKVENMEDTKHDHECLFDATLRDTHGYAIRQGH